MSSKRRRINCALPIDTLSPSIQNNKSNGDGDSGRAGRSELASKGISERYKKFRKDRKIVEKLNHGSTSDFFCSESKVSSMGSGGSIDEGKHVNLDIDPSDSQDEIEKYQQGMLGDMSSEEEEHQRSKEVEEFEPLDGTPPMKRQIKKSNGLLFSSPLDALKNNMNTTTTKLNLCGNIRTIDVRKRSDVKSQCLMKFVNDSSGPRVNFTHRNFEIKNAQIDFTKDCDVIMFDKNDSCIGMVLRESRFIDMDNKSTIGRAQTKLFLWTNNDGERDTKIYKVREILLHSKECKTRVVDSKAMIIKKIDEVAIKEYKNKVLPHCNSVEEAFERRKEKRHFWEKTELSSLKGQRRLSNFTSSSGQKIHVPKVTLTSDRIQHDRSEGGIIPKVSPSKFYSITPSNGPETIKKHATNRSSPRTRSHTPNTIQSTLWNLDDEKNFETPETFKPRLCYKFDDGTSYTITNQDFKCLYNHDWINDSILDFFTKFYVEQAIINSVISRPEVHIMSSFFYTKLISDPTDYYANVKKWVNNCDLFKKKYVVVPININFHWFGCIITNLDLLLEFLKNSQTTSDFNKETEKPDREVIRSATDLKLPKETGEEIHLIKKNDKETSAAHFGRITDLLPTTTTKNKDDDEISISTPIITILTFDSLRQTHTREIDPIKEFLIAYAKDKYSLDLDKTLIKMKTCAVPQQPNMSDCGVHVILNTMKFFENPKQTAEVWRSAKSRGKSSAKLVNEYFERNKRNEARKDLRNVLWELQKEQIKIMNDKNEYPQDSETNVKGHEEDDGDVEIIEDFSEYQRQLQNARNSAADNANPELVKQLRSDPSSAENDQIADTSTKGMHNVEEDTENPQKIQEKYETQITPLRSDRSNQNQDSDGLTNYKSVKSPIDKVVIASPRNFLESSPIKSYIEDRRIATAAGVTSPYFGNSSLRSRGGTFNNTSSESSSSPPDKLGGSPHPETIKNELSPFLRQAEYPTLGEGQSSDAQSVHSKPKKSPWSLSTSPSPARNHRVVIYDVEPDYDVNLIGDAAEKQLTEKDSLTQVRENVEKELNENLIGTKDRNDLHLPQLTLLQDERILSRSGSGEFSKQDIHIRDDFHGEDLNSNTTIPSQDIEAISSDDVRKE